MPRLLDKQRVAAQVQGAAESLKNRHGLTSLLRNAVVLVLRAAPNHAPSATEHEPQS